MNSVYMDDQCDWIGIGVAQVSIVPETVQTNWDLISSHLGDYLKIHFQPSEACQKYIEIHDFRKNSVDLGWRVVQYTRDDGRAPLLAMLRNQFDSTLNGVALIRISCGETENRILIQLESICNEDPCGILVVRKLDPYDRLNKESSPIWHEQVGQNLLALCDLGHKAALIRKNGKIVYAPDFSRFGFSERSKH